MEAAPNKRSYRRFAALRFLRQGVAREVVAAGLGCTERSVRLWITLFNRGGLDALATKPRSGRPRKVKLERLADLLLPVLEQPEAAGEIFWTGVKVHGWLQEQFGVELGYSTVVRYLHELDFKLLVPQPWPERQDEAKRAAFQQALAQWKADPNIELWFCDECGVEGDPRPRRRWAARGSRPTVPYLGEHIRANVVGAVCPATGESFHLIFDGVDTQVFQRFLDDLNHSASPTTKRRLLIVDNASWHKSAQLHWGAFQREFLPPYSPDFNPIERFWLRLKADYFRDFIAKSSEALLDRLSLALCSFMLNTSLVASQCSSRK